MSEVYDLEAFRSRKSAKACFFCPGLDRRCDDCLLEDPSEEEVSDATDESDGAA